ncbi:hypothetical protein LJC13_02060, partial [Peptostreptococcaceae bacterium OttesenSCG-928-C18]|nr:hypothetical protein [Peptostreptococcaceae bacterium OttesenSCG-928-C18]
MNEYNYDEKKLNEYFEKNDLKSAKKYLMITENFSDEEAINFLHKYVNENNINIKKQQDIDYGFKYIIIYLLGILVALIILVILFTGVIKGIISDSVNLSRVLFIIVLLISLVTCFVFFIRLLQDLITKEVIS